MHRPKRDASTKPVPSSVHEYLSSIGRLGGLERQEGRPGLRSCLLKREPRSPRRRQGCDGRRRGAIMKKDRQSPATEKLAATNGEVAPNITPPEGAAAKQPPAPHQVLRIDISWTGFSSAKGICRSYPATRETPRYACVVYRAE